MELIVTDLVSTHSNSSSFTILSILRCFEYTLALIINQTRNTQRSEAKGETRDNEVMIYDLVGDYNTNWHEDVSPRREHEVTTT